MQKLWIANLVSLISLLLALSAGANDLRIYTEENPPLSYTDAGRLNGFAVEVVQALMQRQNQRYAIKVVPWPRAMYLVEREPNILIFSLMWTPERARQLQLVGPLTVVSTGFYARRASSLKISSLADARRLASIGVPRRFYTQDFLAKQGFTNLDETDDPALMLAKLLSGRNPVMVTSDLTLPVLLAARELAPGAVVCLYSFMVSGHYLAFSPHTPPATVRQWQQTLDAMKADGSFARLYRKWFPSRTIPGLKGAYESSVR